MMARDFLVLCSRETLRKEEIERLHWIHWEKWFTSLPPAIHTVRRARLWIQCNVDQTEMTLDSLVVMLRDIHKTECADPRDRVFGLLGVIEKSERARLGIEANYEKTEKEIFCDIWVYLRKLPKWESDSLEMSNVLTILMFSLRLESDREIWPPGYKANELQVFSTPGNDFY